MDTVRRTSPCSSTPPTSALSKHNTCLVVDNDDDDAVVVAMLTTQPKFSEILAAELAGNFFRDLVRSLDDGQPSGEATEGSAATEWSRDIADLIHLSRQMQRDIAAPQQGCTAAAVTVVHPSRGAQPSGTATHRAFSVPPLFLDDEAILGSYARDLVAEHFELATFGAQALPERTPEAAVVPPLESTPPAKINPDQLHIDLKAAPLRRHAAPSVKSQLSTRTHSQRVYPKRHCCLPQPTADILPSSRRPPPPAWKCAALRQTKSARSYRTHCYDFGRVHPELTIVPTVDSVFPQRVQRVEPDATPPVDGDEDKPDNAEALPVEAEERQSVARIVEKFEERTKNIAAEAAMTWHDVLEINVSKVAAAAASAAKGGGGRTPFAAGGVIDQPTQTIPLSGGDGGGGGKSVASGVTCGVTTAADEPIPAIAQCMVQVLPPLHIRGTCRIQRLPDVSVTGPSRTLGAIDDDGHAADDNNLYVQIVHVEHGKLPAAAETSSKKAEAQPMSRANGLQVTVTSTESYEPNDQQSLSTETEPSSAEESTTVSKYTSHQETTDIGGSSTLSTTTPTKPKTDDEKIKSSHRKPHKTQAKPPSTRRSTTKSSASASYSEKPPLVAAHYSENVMKIIEEIFESPKERERSTRPTAAMNLNFTHDSFNIAAIPRNEHQTIGIQTTPKVSTVVSPTTSIFESLLPATEHFAQDIEEASDEHVRITGEVFAQIRERKVARYKLRSSLQLDVQNQEVKSVAQENVEAAAGCQHSTLIQRSLANTFERYPDLKKFFVPAESEKNAPKETASNVCAQPLNTSLPSVRLQNLRKQQQQQQHQHLLAQHPQVQRTIDSIRRDALAMASVRSGRDSLSRSYRACDQTTTDAIQQAAERFLQSVRSPKKVRPMIGAYVEDVSVQQEAEEYLRSVRESDTSQGKSGDLFCTESSTTTNQSSAASTQRSSAKSGDLLLCTDSGEKTTRTTTTMTASLTSADDVSSVIVSPLKLSRGHNSSSLQTTSGTATATITTATGIGQSTTSSMERQMADVVIGRRMMDDSAESSHSNCKCLSH